MTSPGLSDDKTVIVVVCIVIIILVVVLMLLSWSYMYKKWLFSVNKFEQLSTDLKGESTQDSYEVRSLCPPV